MTVSVKNVKMLHTYILNSSCDSVCSILLQQWMYMSVEENWFISRQYLSISQKLVNSLNV